MLEKDPDPADWITVVATGKEFREAEENAKKNGYPNAFIAFLQERNTLNIGGGYEIELSDVPPGEGVEVDRSTREAAGH